MKLTKKIGFLSSSGNINAMPLPLKPLDQISEDLLYYVWNLKLFDYRDLKTTAGKTLRIIQSGTRNEHSGPDFLQARIAVEDQIWVGNVEMHLRASDWNRHKHQNDPAFQNVILHVVFLSDVPVSLPNGEELMCLEIGDRIPKHIIQNYEELRQSFSWIPCERNLKPLLPVNQRAWFERILVERLMEKTTKIQTILENTENDWEECFYRVLGRNFGFGANNDSFEALTYVLPRMILAKHKNSLLQIEALLFGQAGFLSGLHPSDPYQQSLTEEYRFLRVKYKLDPLPAHQWKFMRLRPANFPTIRLAQFAVLFFRSTHLFSKMLAARSVKEIENMFSSEVSGYWKSHFQFGEPSDNRSKKLGKDSIQLLIINTVVPFLFHYGAVYHDVALQERALKLLEDLPPENNNVIRKFSKLSLTAESSFDSQALLQQKSTYCASQRCLECAIGNSILNNHAKSSF